MTALRQRDSSYARDWAKGDRVTVVLPDQFGIYGRRGSYQEIVGTVTDLDATGVTVTFDRPFNGLPNCHATRWELRTSAKCLRETGRDG